MKITKGWYKVFFAKILSYVIGLDVISMALQISFARKVIVLQTALNMVNQFNEEEPKVDPNQQKELIQSVEEVKRKLPKVQPLSKWLR